MEHVYLYRHNTDIEKDENQEIHAGSEEPDSSLVLLFERYCEDEDMHQQKHQKRGSGRLVHWSRIQMDNLIGQGSFSRVYKVHLKKEPTDLSTRKQHHLALKCPNTQALKASSNGSSLSDALQDLEIETKILSQCDHVNIVRLHGVVRLCGYSLPLLELLMPETLGGCIAKWKSQDAKYMSCLCLFECFDTFRGSEINQRPITPDAIDRMIYRVENVALGVAEGMEYLHKNQIVLRDLKPENIGFDKIGVPKIFDFGFARNIKELQRQFQDKDDSEYEVAGTPSYMPPEALVGAGVMPDLSCDVYAFGMILWEICTLKRASSESSRCSPRIQDAKKPAKKPVDCGWSQFDKVVEPGVDDQLVRTESDDRRSKDADQHFMYWRPSVIDIPLPRIKRLILECWAHHQVSRPGFDRIVRVMRLAVKQVTLTTEESTKGTLQAQAQSSNGSSTCSPVANNENVFIGSGEVDSAEPSNTAVANVAVVCLDDFIEMGSSVTAVANVADDCLDDFFEIGTKDDGGESPTVGTHRGNGEDTKEVATVIIDKTKQRQTRRRSRRKRRKRWFRWFSSPRNYEAYTSDRTSSSYSRY